MPPTNRDTERRNFSLSVEASEAIDEFAESENLSKSMVVENAVLEHTHKDATSRIEEKVDELLTIVKE